MASLEVTRSESGVATIRLTRPDRFNAMNFHVIEEFQGALTKLAASDIRVLVIAGSGKSFCSGADLKEIKDFSPETGEKFSRVGHDLFFAISRFPVPTIAAVNGYALGGGCELACAADVIIAGPQARFGQPEAKVGMITGWGGTWRLQERIGRSRAKELYYTGRIIDAAKAYTIGLVDRVLDSEDFDASLDEYAELVAAMAPVAIKLQRELIDMRTETPEERSTAEARALKICIETDDQTEGVSAFLEKRQARFIGS